MLQAPADFHSITYFEAGVVDSWKAQKKDHCHRRDWALQTGPDGRDVPMGCSDYYSGDISELTNGS